MHVVGKPSFRVEDVEIDTLRGCVNRHGQEEYLRHQAFQVLTYLVEHRQRLVEKDELIENIWHDTAVTDNALVQCILDIRKALGDDARHPRFIKTIPKAGYRFIGPVEEYWPEEEPEISLEEEPAPGIEARENLSMPGTEPLPAEPVVARGRRRWLLVAAGCALAVAALVLLAVWLRGRAHDKDTEITLQHVAGKKPLAVMFFENQSGRADLAWLSQGLADMLIADLARSNRLTVLSRQQLDLLLERIGHNPADTIRLDDAMALARRSHAEALVLGTFAALGEEIRITVQLHDAGSGQMIAADHLVVSRPSDILTQIDLLSLKVLERLGVAAPAPGAQSGLAEAMTDNLQAYRYYSLGVEKARAFDNAEAIRLLEKAVKLDPKFAMAYARIGYAYAVTDFLPDAGRPYLEKAFQLSARLTEKDRLNIMAWYAIARRDYPGAIEGYRKIVVQYPFESEGYWRLARLLRGEERAEEAITVLNRGLAADPEAKNLYNELGGVLLSLDRYSEAIAASQHYVALAPKEANAHDSLGMCYQKPGRYEEAAAEYAAALTLNPEFEPAITHLGDVYFQQGRYREAVSQYQRYVRASRSDVARAIGYSNIAYTWWKKGEIARAGEAARSEMRYKKGAVWNSIVLALARNDKRKADKLKEQLFAQLPYQERGARPDLRSREYFQGYLELKNGNGGEALRHFSEALRHPPPSSGIDIYEDCLANAYLELARPDDAIREYQRILKLNPNYPLAEYHLAQACERKGDAVQARAAYQRFLRIWARADTDIAEVLHARTAVR